MGDRSPQPAPRDDPEGAAPIPPHPASSGSQQDPLEAASPIPPPAGEPSAHPPPSARPPGAVGEGGISVQAFVDVLKIRQFRLLFWGQAISALGDWVGTLAFIVAAGELAPGNEAPAIAVVLVLRLLPSLFATPLGGVLSDRYDRKRLMVWTDIIRFGIIALVPFIPKLGVLYALAFTQEVFSLIFLPARDATLPNIIPRERLEPANALIMGSSFAGIPLAGPVFALLALAGSKFPSALPGAFIFHERGYAFPFVFDALTYLVSAWFIVRMAKPPQRLAPGEGQEHFWDSARDGARYIKGSPLHRGLAWSVSVGMLGGGVLFALGKSYVEDTLGGGNVEFGWLMGLFGAGMVMGFFVSQLKPPGGVMWMVRISLLAMGGVLAFMAMFSVLWIGYLAAVGFGLAFSVSVIVAMSAIQAETDDDHRGRVMGAVHMLYRGALVFGALGSAGIATFVPDEGYDLPFGFTPDKNQFALLVAGGLIAAGTVGVRGARAPARE